VEILINTGGATKLIDTDRVEKLVQLMELSAGDGMQTFDQALQQLLANGQISREEALAHSANPDALRMAFQGVVLSETRRILGS
jgi:Tfp pilus assembly ATPase PilU